MKGLVYSALVLLCGVCLAQESSTEVALAALAYDFEDKKASLREPLTQLEQLYATSLQELKEASIKAGNLEHVLAVDAELAGYLDGKTPEAGTEFPQLARLQKIYRKTYPKRVARVKETLKRTTASYCEELEVLQVSLTRQEKIPEALKVKAVIDSLDRWGLSITRTFPLDDLEALLKDWRLKGGGAAASENGLKLPRGPGNELESLFRMKGDFEVLLEFHFGQAAYTNTGGTWIKACGQKITITNKWNGFGAKIKVERKGNLLLLTHNGKVEERKIAAEDLEKPTTFYLWWRSRSAHFKKLSVMTEFLPALEVAPPPEPEEKK